MSTILAIDPGPVESAWCRLHSDGEPIHFGKIDNVELRSKLLCASVDVEADHVAVEMITSYGMSVGADVFETCVWIGRFCEAIRGNWWPYTEPERIKRLPVKVHHCHTAKATDANIRQALVDRFAPNVGNHGKGTKAEPGWFYGFRADIWQAYALGVYVADQLEGRTP